MRSLRRRLSERLLAVGTTIAIDRGEMVRSAWQSGQRQFSSQDLQILFMLDLVSGMAIKLGMALLPAGLPEPMRHEPTSHE